MVKAGQGLGYEAVMALDAGGTFFKAALVTRGGELIEESRLHLRVDAAGDADSIRLAYKTIVKNQLCCGQRLGLTIAGIAVDTPGPFDFDRCASAMKHKFQSIYGIPLKPWISEAAAGIPILFLHDSTAFMLGEAWKGEAQGYADAAGVMLGTGLGFACMKEGQVLLNPHKGPAIALYRRPYAGKTAEDAISRRGIIEKYRKRVKYEPSEDLDVLEISIRARAGDAAARGAFEETGQQLGEILTPVLGQLETSCLVVGGQISKSFDLLKGGLLKELEAVDCLKKAVPCGQSDDAHLLGCAWAFWNREI